MKNDRREWSLLASLSVVVLLLSTLAMPVAAEGNLQSGWHSEYFANRSLRGNPVQVRGESAIDFNWGNGSPGNNVPADNFSARWTQMVAFEGGRYRFDLHMDDGARLFIDNRAVIDTWNGNGGAHSSVELDLSAGWHKVRVEYYDAQGNAQAHLSWHRVAGVQAQAPAPGNAVVPEPKVVENTPPPAPANNNRPFVDTSPSVTHAGQDGNANNNDVNNLPPQDSGTNDPNVPAIPAGHWRGEYYNNRDLSGGARFIRADASIDFDWGTGTPDSRVGSDDFSIRWTQEIYFQGGRYNFTAEVDDGVKVWVDDVKIISEWNKGSKKITRGVPIGEGKHTIKMEYFEAGGNAKAKLWWEGPLPPRVGNLITWVPPFPSYSWVKVYKLDGDHWVDINQKGFASISPGGFLKIDGLQVYRRYGGSGHPYWIELWINGVLARSVGNTHRGEPEFRIYPDRDNYTPW